MNEVADDAERRLRAIAHVEAAVARMKRDSTPEGLARTVASARFMLARVLPAIPDDPDEALRFYAMALIDPRTGGGIR